MQFHLDVNVLFVLHLFDWLFNLIDLCFSSIWGNYFFLFFCTGPYIVLISTWLIFYFIIIDYQTFCQEQELHFTCYSICTCILLHVVHSNLSYFSFYMYSTVLILRFTKGINWQFEKQCIWSMVVFELVFISLKYTFIFSSFLLLCSYIFNFISVLINWS